MKRMYIVVIAVALGFCAFLALRHAVRTAPLVPSKRADVTATPMDRVQDRIRIDARTDYSADPEAKKRLMEKLRQEELRQKPEARRN